MTVGRIEQIVSNNVQTILWQRIHFGFNHYFRVIFDEFKINNSHLNHDKETKNNTDFGRKPSKRIKLVLLSTETYLNEITTNVRCRKLEHLYGFSLNSLNSNAPVSHRAVCIFFSSQLIKGNKYRYFKKNKFISM